MSIGSKFSFASGLGAKTQIMLKTLKYSFELWDDFMLFINASLVEMTDVSL